MRDREVDAAHVEGTHAPDRRRQIAGQNLDRKIAPVEPALRKGRLEHHHGRVLRDGMAKDADEFGPIVGCVCHGCLLTYTPHGRTARRSLYQYSSTWSVP